jgi:5,5'-dehydrodivanillate O-demethylase
LLEGEPEDCDDWTIGHPILFPFTLANVQGNGGSHQLRIPMDDTHTLHILYDVRHHSEKEGPKPLEVERRGLAFDEFGRVFGGTERAVPQDEMAWIGQGPISDRTREHLATSDKGVIMYHNLLLEQAEKVERGEEPIALVRDPEKNFPMIVLHTEQASLTPFQRQDAQSPSR